MRYTCNRAVTLPAFIAFLALSVLSVLFVPMPSASAASPADLSVAGPPAPAPLIDFSNEWSGHTWMGDGRLLVVADNGQMAIVDPSADTTQAINLVTPGLSNDLEDVTRVGETNY